MDLSQPAQGKLSQILELVGASFTTDVNGEPTTFMSPFLEDPGVMQAYMPVIMDKLTTVEAKSLPGRININEAPREVLAGIPGFTQELVDSLMKARAEQTESNNRKFETWPLVESYIPLQQMKLVAPLLTGGGDVYSAQVIGYYENGSSFARLETIIDASASPPKIVFYRNHYERGFANGVLGQRTIAGMGL